MGINIAYHNSLCSIGHLKCNSRLDSVTFVNRLRKINRGKHAKTDICPPIWREIYWNTLFYVTGNAGYPKIIVNCFWNNDIHIKFYPKSQFHCCSKISHGDYKYKACIFQILCEFNAFCLFWFMQSTTHFDVWRRFDMRTNVFNLDFKRFFFICEISLNKCIIILRYPN